MLKVGQGFGENTEVQIQVEIKGNELSACHKNPGGVALEPEENKGMIFHVFLASPMYCRLHFSVLHGRTPALRGFCFPFSLGKRVIAEGVWDLGSF